MPPPSKPHPLAAPTRAGVSHAGAPISLRAGELPKLEVEKIRRACDHLARGEGGYRALLYLSHARAEEVPTLMQASRAGATDERWRLLWVLCPVLARLARSPQGRRLLGEELRRDMAAVQIIARFVSADHIAVERLLNRTHDELLDILLDKLVALHHDAQRAGLLRNLVAVVEKRSAPLRAALEKVVPKDQPQTVERLLGMLDVRDDEAQLSPSALRDKLLALEPKRRPSDDEPGDPR